MSSGVRVGVVTRLYRYPVKSLLGEPLDAAVVNRRGVEGDREWAVYTADGGIGSGKTSRRFRRVDGLLRLRATLDDGAPRLHLPDGRTLRADDPSATAVLSALFGQPLELRTETTVPHHDDSPLHLVTTTAFATLGRELGSDVDVERFRPNVVVDTLAAGLLEGYPEDRWTGRELALGDEVVVGIDGGMPRCVMVSAEQADLPRDPAVLSTLGRVHDVEFGLQASVVRGGVIRPADSVRLLP
jgi:MOSC domain-containing protein